MGGFLQFGKFLASDYNIVTSMNSTFIETTYKTLR